MGYVYACSINKSIKFVLKYTLLYNLLSWVKQACAIICIYTVFVKSKEINGGMNIYAAHFILPDSLSENFVRYSFIHFEE